ncbi:MAG: hypothetical protein WCY89_09445 [Flavobacteriaceae bacterium]
MNHQNEKNQERKGVKSVMNPLTILFREPLPEEDVITLSQEYNRISIGGQPLRNEFLLNADQFIAAISEAKKKYANFVFIQQDGELSLMLHLSDLEDEKEEGDLLYYFVEDKGIFELVQEPDLDAYTERTTEYCTKLGNDIAAATGTGIHNTEIISYTTIDILIFWMCHLAENPNDTYNHLELKMMQFQPILSSAHNTHYTDHQNKIAFAVRLDYGIGIKTDYYDFGNRRP